MSVRIVMVRGLRHLEISKQSDSSQHDAHVENPRNTAPVQTADEDSLSPLGLGSYMFHIFQVYSKRPFYKDGSIPPLHLHPALHTGS